MNSIDRKPKGIKSRGDRKIPYTSTMSLRTLEALDALTTKDVRRNALIEKAVKSYYLIG